MENIIYFNNDNHLNIIRSVIKLSTSVDFRPVYD